MGVLTFGCKWHRACVHFRTLRSSFTDNNAYKIPQPQWWCRLPSCALCGKRQYSLHSLWQILKTALATVLWHHHGYTDGNGEKWGAIHSEVQCRHPHITAEDTRLDTGYTNFTHKFCIH